MKLQSDISEVRLKPHENIAYAFNQKSNTVGGANIAVILLAVTGHEWRYKYIEAAVEI